jgi:aryl-alcohol dehydrogenase-like predicted oxidoreductase
MEYRSLGKTGLQVSVACYGTMTFGWAPDDWGSHEEDSLRLTDVAFELGINFFDTADVYARGVSETILGKALAGRRDRRDAAAAERLRGPTVRGVSAVGRAGLGGCVGSRLVVHRWGRIR